MRSFSVEGKAPCGLGLYHACPALGPELVVLPPAADAWDGLDINQRNMWLVSQLVS